MRMLFIANIRLPTEKAHGIQIMKMCEAFARLGAEVELIVPQRVNDRLSAADPFDYYRVKPVFTLTFLPVVDPVFLMKLPQGVYIKAQAFFFLRALRRYSAGKTSDGSVWYTRDEYLLPALHRLHDNVVWEAHTLPRHIARYRQAFAACRRIVAITQSLKKLLCAEGVAEQKVVVAPDGFDPAQFSLSTTRMEARNALNLAHDKTLIVYTGHLYPWKGIGTLLEASELLPGDCEIIIAGGTEHDVNEWKKKLTPSHRARFLGHRPYAEIPLLMRAADLLVLPNSGKYPISSQYTSPMKLFEYMASGTPIVASDVPAVREVLSEKSAFMFEADNAQTLAEVILFARAHPVSAQAQAAAAKIDASNYTWEKRAKKIIESIGQGA